MQNQFWRSGFGALLVGVTAFGVLLGAASAQQPPAKKASPQQGKPKMNVGYSDTPFLPGDKWRVHDGERTQPTVITPPPFTTSTPPPSDAVVLFDGKSLSGWKQGNGDECKWKLTGDGAMEVVRGAGDILSKEEFGDCQLHLEFKTPAEVKGDGQGRGNSGVFLFGRYEIQVLDCYNNPTYADGTVGAVYGQTPPLVNASRKPGEWQVYDIIWQSPRWKDGNLERPAAVTVVLNGVVVQGHTVLIGETSHRVVGTYKEHAPTGPIKLQDHGDPIQFRNIWVRRLVPTS